MAAVDPSSAASSRLRGEVRHGDAYELMGTLAPESVDLIITSPPYWGTTGGCGPTARRTTRRSCGSGSPKIRTRSTARRTSGIAATGGVLGMEPIPEWYVDHLVEIFGRGDKALKPGGSVWVNIGDTYFARWSSIRYSGRQGMGDNPRERRRAPMGGYRQEKQLLMIPARFAIAMQAKRWILRNDLIWHKPNVAPRPERDRLRLAHEHLFHFVKRPTQGRAAYWYDLNGAEEGARDVVTVNAKAGSDGHSATFPEGLITPRILSSCPPGGTVLDPFAGTARALTIALDHGRNAVGSRPPRRSSPRRDAMSRRRCTAPTHVCRCDVSQNAGRKSRRGVVRPSRVSGRGGDPPSPGRPTRRPLPVPDRGDRPRSGVREEREQRGCLHCEQRQPHARTPGLARLSDPVS